MRNKLLAGFLLAAGCVVFSLRGGHAVPLDLSYRVAVSTTTVTSADKLSIVISSTTFPSANTYTNTNVANYQWCISHVYVGTPGGQPSTFSMFYSTSPFGFNTGTTDYVVTPSTSTGIYEQVWTHSTPYCAPIGAKILNLRNSVSGSTITAEGYLYPGYGQ